MSMFNAIFTVNGLFYLLAIIRKCKYFSFLLWEHLLMSCS